jgi:hypothetical protein
MKLRYKDETKQDSISIPIEPISSISIQMDSLIEVERWRHFEGSPELVMRTDDGFSVEVNRKIAANIIRCHPRDLSFRIAKISFREYLELQSHETCEDDQNDFQI